MARILIVDDDRPSREALAALLAREGHEARGAAGDAAVPAATGAFMPDLLLLDVGPDEGAALGVVRAVRADPALESVSIVLLGRPGSRVAPLIDAGADGCVTRPMEDAEFLARVRARLRQHGLLRSWQQSESALRAKAAQLEGNVAMLRMATQLARLGGWAIDMPGRSLRWSDESCQIHDVAPGYRPTLEEGLAMFPPECREEVTRKVEACARDGTPYTFEVPKITATGRRIWVRSIGEAVRDGEGRIVRLQGAFQDITEWKLAEEALRQKEAELQQAAQRLATTLENMSEGFYVLDAQWRFEYVNAEAARQMQSEREKMVGRVVWELFPEARESAAYEEFHAAVRDGRPSRFEMFFAPLGNWFEVDAHPSPGGLAVYFRVITARKLAEAALRESERELRSLAESMPQMVWMAGRDGGSIYFNQRWVDYTGLGVAESLGRRWIEAIHPGDRDAVRVAWDRAIREDGTFGIECRIRRVDGDYRWMLARGIAFRDERGTTLKWMGTYTDIDDLKRAEQSVRESEERFRLLSRATHDAIWDWDLARGGLWWNDGFETLFGYRRDRIEPGIDAWTSRIHPEDRDRIVADVHAAIDAGREIWTGDYRFRRHDGTYARVHDRGYVIRDAAGRAVRMVGGMTDVTERLALEEQLRQSQRLDSLGHLTGGVAHDFNNLLTVILGNAELLAEELQDHPQLAQLARTVAVAADRGAELTQRLLAFARKQALAPRPIDVNGLTTLFEPLLRRTLGEHIAIDIRRAADLWPALVDAAQLESALLNLCINARDAMSAGGRLAIQTANATLDPAYAERQTEVRPGDYVMLAVSDTGTGMAPEILGRVFEPFFTTKPKGKGTGLGLPMVYGFVKQSGGHVHIDSEPGRGTTVRLYLPRADREAAATASALPPGQAAATAESVLLVEDEDLVRRSAHGHLASLGYRVIEARDGPHALEILRAGQPVDLLFTDVVMPGMSGRELADAALKLRPQLKVLYTSGYTEDAIVHHGRLDPGLHLLPKPYRRDDLARKLRAVLRSG